MAFIRKKNGNFNIFLLITTFYCIGYSMYKFTNTLIKHLYSYLGWVLALNMAAVLSMAGWIPTLIGIDVQTYVLWAFFISLPVAGWIEIGCGGKN